MFFENFSTHKKLFKLWVCLILVKFLRLNIIKFCGTTFLTVCSIREYRSNVTETCYVQIEGYRSINRRLRRLPRRNKLNRHVEQTCYRQAPETYRQAN